MPFLTEELWHAIYDENPPFKSIAMCSYLETGVRPLDAIAQGGQAQLDMFTIFSLADEINSLRKEIGVEERASTPIEVRTDTTNQVS